MTPQRRTKNQKRKTTPNSKVKNNARKSRLSMNLRKRRSRGQRRKSNKSIQKSQEVLKTLKRSVINEYARNLQPMPVGEVFQCMTHLNKSRIVSNQRKSLRNCTNDYAIAPTEDFHSCRKFATNEGVHGVRSLNIEVSTQANKLDEKVSQDLQSLNLDDKVNAQNNNNNLKVASNSDENNKKSDANAINLFNNASVIEISDSSDVKDSSAMPRNDGIPSDVENNDVICLDDMQSNDDDSDIIFIGGKRKSVFELENIPKHRKTDNSVIVIDDDEVPLRKSPKKRIRKRANKSKAQMNKRITKSSTPLHQNFGHFLATSTPNKVTSSETHNCIKCLCVGSHSCAAKPNLATIPEEPGDKRNNNALNSAKENVQNSLERTRSLLEYNNLDMLGGNFLSAGPIRTQGLRPIFIDGSNIAMGHSNGRFFSVKGLKICIDYFLKRGHEVTAIVPMFRKKRSQNSDPGLLKKLENRGLVVFTPARTVKGRHIVPYDDRYLVLMAAVHQGIVVSSDNFNDLLAENPQMAETIERRVLNPTWIKDMIIFPVDPLGRNGPSLNEFLQFP